MNAWTPALATGVAQIDEQHQNIFQWLAELESATGDKRTLLGVYAITRLKQFIREHFAQEEKLMRAASYPGLAEHMAEHAAFRAKLGELQQHSIGHDISQETVDFLKAWVTEHISKTDMAYVPYLNKAKAVPTQAD